MTSPAPSDDLTRTLPPAAQPSAVLSALLTSRGFADGISSFSPGGRERYRVVGVIGRGGLGEVLLAEDTHVGRMVALKVPLPGRESASALGQLSSEARTIAQLDHPGVVMVHDAGVDFLAMRRLEGQTFQQCMHQWAPSGVAIRDPAVLARAVEILSAVADCMAFAHSRGVLHRDLKPANIMVGGFGEVVVLDWGLAATPTLLRARPELACAGTPSYMAPEVARGDVPNIGPASDVFQIGAMLYRVLSGRAPFAAATAQDSLVAAAAAHIAALDAEAPRELAALALRLLSEQPAQRPSAAEAASALRDWRHAARSQAEAAQRASAALARAAQIADHDRVALATLIGSCEQIRGLDPQATPAIELQRVTRQRLLAAHLAAGDIAAARIVADALGDRAAQQRVGAAEASRARRAHQLRVMRWSGAALAALLLLSVLAWLAWRGAADQRALVARIDAARAVIAQAESALRAAPADAGPLPLRAIQGQARRALGLAGSDPAMRRAAQDVHAACVQRLVAWAVEHREPSLIEGEAVTLAVAALDPQSAASYAATAAALRARLAAEADAPRQRWIAALRRATGLADPLGIAGAQCDEAVIQIAAWNGSALDEVLEGLRTERRPELDRLLAGVLRLRLERDPAPLRALLTHPDRSVSLTAWAALVERGVSDARALDMMTEHMHRLAQQPHGAWAARQAGAWLDEATALVLIARGVDPLLVGDYATWCTRLRTGAADGENLAPSLAASAAWTVWIHSGDAALARACADRAPAHDARAQRLRAQLQSMSEAYSKETALNAARPVLIEHDPELREAAASARAGAWSRAARLGMLVCELQEGAPHAAAFAARAWHAAGNATAAQRAVDRALAMNPEHPDVLEVSAWLSESARAAAARQEALRAVRWHLESGRMRAALNSTHRCEARSVRLALGWVLATQTATRADLEAELLGELAVSVVHGVSVEQIPRFTALRFAALRSSTTPYIAAGATALFACASQRSGAGLMAWVERFPEPCAELGWAWPLARAGQRAGALTPSDLPWPMRPLPMLDLDEHTRGLIERWRDDLENQVPSSAWEHLPQIPFATTSDARDDVHTQAREARQRWLSGWRP